MSEWSLWRSRELFLCSDILQVLKPKSLLGPKRPHNSCWNVETFRCDQNLYKSKCIYIYVIYWKAKAKRSIASSSKGVESHHYRGLHGSLQKWQCPMSILRKKAYVTCLLLCFIRANFLMSDVRYCVYYSQFSHVLR